jgi:hypothetical protein
VAINYVGIKTFGRSGGKRGSRATSAAAYRAGERIRDERTGAVYDHHRRRDVMHKEIVLPAKLARAGRELDWARDRATLWNAAEHAEVRKNARVAREFVVGLPHELSHGQRTSLAQRFAQELANRYGNAIDIAIHAPRGDPRNFHAHLLATTREIGPEGLGRKTTLELSGTERYSLGLPRWTEETADLRKRWATLANEALEKAHVPARVESASLTGARSQGLSPPRLPLIAYHIEQRGGRSFLAERIREAHRKELARAGPHTTDRAEVSHLGRAQSKRVEPTPSPARTTVLQQLWTKTREAWAALSGRSRAAAPNEPSRTSAPYAPTHGHSPREGQSRAVLADEIARESALNWLRYREQEKRQQQERDPRVEQGHRREQEHQQGAARRSEHGHEQDHTHRQEPQHERNRSHGYDLGL